MGPNGPRHSSPNTRDKCIYIISVFWLSSLFFSFFSFLSVTALCHFPSLRMVVAFFSSEGFHLCSGLSLNPPLVLLSALLVLVFFVRPHIQFLYKKGLMSSLPFWSHWFFYFMLWPWNRWRESCLSKEAKHWKKPKHIGFIMDGNRRFARIQSFKNVLEGHEFGAQKLHDVLKWCFEQEINTVTVWGLSTDNFNRPKKELDEIYEVCERHLEKLVDHELIATHDVRICHIGERDLLPQKLLKVLDKVEDKTKDHSRFTLNIAFAYGGREEIVSACRTLVSHEIKKALLEHEREGRNATLHWHDAIVKNVSEHIDAENIALHLYTKDCPEPDLIIRTSGEFRLGGFLLWQTKYSEFHFCDKLWPEFEKKDLLLALKDFHRRKRRFGR
jgi:short-chain Z-isoprenyl diphosphate synthase